MGKDVDGKNSSKRFKAKKSWLIRKGMSEEEAHKKARAYAGGKTSPKAGQTEEPIIEEFSAYTNLVELPEEVKGLLPVEAQEVWMQAFNSLVEGKDRVKCEESAWTAVEGAGYTVTVKASEMMGKFHGLIALGEAMLMPAPSGMQYSSTSIVEIIRTGQWEHPLYGPLSITETSIDGFVANFFANVRGIDIAVDQEHKPEEGAMGWFKKLWKIPRDDGDGYSMMAEIQWTYQGEQLIRDGVYRYFSPEFLENWKDPESGKTYKYVLFGGALTNRPFIKNMDPILLSEGVMETLGFVLKTQPGGNRKNNQGGTDVKLLAEHYKALGLSENATEAEVLAAIAAVKASQAPAGTNNADVVQLSETVKVMKESLDAAQVQIKQLSETNILLAEAAKAVRWESISQKAFSEGRMTVALSEKFKPLFMANPESIGAIIEDLPKIIPGEKGHSNAGGAGGEGTSKLSESQIEVAKMLGLSEDQMLKGTPEWMKAQGGKE